jgi:phosphatidylglycerophosphate synthase
MIDKLSTILFLCGLLVLIVVHDRGVIWVVMCVVVLITSWIIREARNKETYTNYPYGYKSGKLVGGTVYTSYPDLSPGLGWVL